MINLQELIKFISEANKAGYASGNEGALINESDNSKTIVYENGDFKFHDNYFGGEPYGGREVIFYEGKPVFIMVYYGRISDKNIDKKTIYSFLQNALKLFPEDKPFRGPEQYEEIVDGKKLEYKNNWSGEIEYFSGKEIILIDGVEVYDARYSGGLIDQ